MGRGEKDEALWLVPAFLLHVRTARGSVGARESLYQSPVDALHFVLNMQNATRIKTVFGGVAGRGQMLCDGEAWRRGRGP
jgi:hypothetical protein